MDNSRFRGKEPLCHPRMQVGKYCKGCTDRYPGCQDHCKKAQELKREWNKLRHLIRQHEDTDRRFNMYRTETVEKNIKRRNSNG